MALREVFGLLLPGKGSEPVFRKHVPEGGHSGHLPKVSTLAISENVLTLYGYSCGHLPEGGRSVRLTSPGTSPKHPLCSVSYLTHSLPIFLIPALMVRLLSLDGIAANLDGFTGLVDPVADLFQTLLYHLQKFERLLHAGPAVTARPPAYCRLADVQLLGKFGVRHWSNIKNSSNPLVDRLR